MPSKSEESSMDASLRLRFVQHDKTEDVMPSTARNPSLERLVPSGFFTALRSVQNDKTKSVIPSQSEESSMDASLRSA